ncbi:MAG: LysM peptidoglycan-binding protein [Glaciihabitans sp.]|nr:LysM peptidoglycan-binding protein [Glaciihabitans sp.]
MTTTRDDDSAVFPAALAGLIPTRLAAPLPPARHPAHRERVARGLFATVPIVLVGSLAMASLNLGTNPENSGPKRPPKPKADTADLGSVVRDALARASATAAIPASTLPSPAVQTATAPSTYVVRGGDTVSEIAGRFGLSTASVLAMNGLSWKSVIFPGQHLKLSKSAPVVTKAPAPAVHTAAASSTVKYTIRSGDTISRIANKFGVTTQSVLTANHLKWSSIIYPGQKLLIPTKSAATKPPVTKPPVTPPPVTAPPASAPPTTSNGSYTIKSGDTLTSIAKKFSVTVAALQKANGLTSSSIIYAGHKLVIPGLSTASVGGETVPLSPAMKTNATTIIRVGQSLGVPEYGIVIALAAAAQESGLQNLSGGDRDSVGLFQQRPSTGWGTAKQLSDTTYASKLFYGGPSNPNKGHTRGLLDIPGWQSMTVTKAAQAVQISGYPTAYAKWETSARSWLAALK